MKDFKIGIMVDSLRMGVDEGIKKAAEMGAQGIQIYAVSGEFSPQSLSAGRKAALRGLISGCGLEISALCGDLGGHGFSKKEENPEKIEKSKRIMDLACEMGARVVTTHIGVIPSDETSDQYKVMQEACECLGAYGDAVGARFAVETGPETPEVLGRFLRSLSSRGVGVNYDPANLVMVTGSDPAEGVITLSDLIVHTHAKDGVMKKKTDPAVIYHFFAEGGIEDLRMEDYFLETPLGQGKVDFPGWLGALKSVGYDGFLTIEREVGTDPAADIAMAVGFLNGLSK